MRSQVVIAEIQTDALTRFATDETDDTTTLYLEKFLCDTGRMASTASPMPTPQRDACASPHRLDLAQIVNSPADTVFRSGDHVRETRLTPL